MSTNDQEIETKTVATPEGRLINESLFEKDKFDDKATPSYKMELAIDNDADFEALEEALYQAAVAEWGEEVVDKEWNADEILLPFKDGDTMATRREEKGKPGDAYKGKTVIRAHTIYNKDGSNGPGGIQVYDTDLSEIGAVNRSAIYSGCYGEAGVTVGCYIDSRTDAHALMFYLVVFHKTKDCADDERLVTAADHSKLFKPVGKKASGRSTGRAGGRKGRSRKEVSED